MVIWDRLEWKKQFWGTRQWEVARSANESKHAGTSSYDRHKHREHKHEQTTRAEIFEDFIRNSSRVAKNRKLRKWRAKRKKKEGTKLELQPSSLSTATTILLRRPRRKYANSQKQRKRREIECGTKLMKDLRALNLKFSSTESRVCCDDDDHVGAWFELNLRCRRTRMCAEDVVNKPQSHWWLIGGDHRRDVQITSHVPLKPVPDHCNLLIHIFSLLWFISHFVSCSAGTWSRSKREIFSETREIHSPAAELSWTTTMIKTSFQSHALRFT